MMEFIKFGHAYLNFSTFEITSHDTEVRIYFLMYTQHGIYTKNWFENYFSEFIKKLWLTGDFTRFFMMDKNFGISIR